MYRVDFTDFQNKECRCRSEILSLFRYMWNVDVGDTKYPFSPMSNVDVAHGLESLV